jgi:hypothetical protein
MKTETKLLLVKVLLEIYIVVALTILILLVLHRKGCVL